MIYEQPLNPEREKHISNIAKQLQSSEFAEVAMKESIGGNAGRNRLAVNAFADKKSGEIIKFGNWQDIQEEIRDNPNFGLVTFVKDIGSLSRPNTKGEVVPGRFVRVHNGGFGKSVSPQALANIEEAVRRVNKEIKHGP